MTRGCLLGNTNSDNESSNSSNSCNSNSIRVKVLVQVKLIKEVQAIEIVFILADVLLVELLHSEPSIL